MALLLKVGVETYIHLRDDLRDPRTDDWFLVHSPIKVVFVLIMYYMLVRKWLPKYMKNRKPFDLRSILVYYNVVQIGLNGYIFMNALRSVHTLNIKCSPVDYSNDPHAVNFAELTWFYYMVKLIDMLDTIFFVLRKKDNQVSFLHVYHHNGMVFTSWIATKYLAGGESIFLGLINSFVHMVMYSYYLFAAWKPEMKDLINKIKKHVTQLQLLQFILLFLIYSPKTVIDCGFPKYMLMTITPQFVVMMLMFGDFYYRTYIKNGTQVKLTKPVEETN